MTACHSAEKVGDKTTREIVSITPLKDSSLHNSSKMRPLCVMGMAPWHTERVGDKARIVLNSYRGKLFDEAFETTITMADDFKHVAYVARDGIKTFVVVNQREEPPYENIGGDAIRLSHDGSQVVYPVHVSLAKTVLVRNGKELPESNLYNGFFSFSPDGKHYAYPVLAKDATLSKVYCDGKVVATHEMASVSHLSFSPDSKHILYVLHQLKRNGKQCTVINAKQGPLLDNIQWAYPGWEQVFFFSPDHSRVAYVGRKAAKHVLVVDQNIESYHDEKILNVIFSPDGKRIALVTANQNNTQWFLLYRNIRINLPVGHAIRGRFVTFSPDGTHFALVTQAKGGYTLQIDGIPGAEYVSIGSIEFISNSRIRYIVERPEGKFMSVEEEFR